MLKNFFVTAVRYGKLLGILTETRELGILNSNDCFALIRKGKMIPDRLIDAYDFHPDLLLKTCSLSEFLGTPDNASPNSEQYANCKGPENFEFPISEF